MARWTYLFSRELQTEPWIAASRSTAAIIYLKKQYKHFFLLLRKGWAAINIS